MLSLTSEAHSDALVQSVIKAFDSDRALMVDEGFRLELGSYAEIPPVLFEDDLTAIYFARADESKFVEILNRQQTFVNIVSLPKSPPRVCRGFGNVRAAGVGGPNPAGRPPAGR